MKYEVFNKQVFLGHIPPCKCKISMTKIKNKLGLSCAKLRSAEVSYSLTMVELYVAEIGYYNPPCLQSKLPLTNKL